MNQLDQIHQAIANDTAAARRLGHEIADLEYQLKAKRLQLQVAEATIKANRVLAKSLEDGANREADRMARREKYPAIEEPKPIAIGRIVLD